MSEVIEEPIVETAPGLLLELQAKYAEVVTPAAAMNFLGRCVRAADRYGT
jgi:hypothetical protein